MIDDMTGATRRTELGGRPSKAFRGVARIRSLYEKDPSVLVREYVQLAQDHCRYTQGRKVWHLADYTDKIKPAFWRNRGMWRVHHYLSNAINLMAFENRPDKALALLCQLSKGVRQSVIDSNSWHSAALMIPIPDPMGKVEFVPGPTASSTGWRRITKLWRTSARRTPRA